MEFKNYNAYFFFAALALVAIVAFLIVRPLLIPFILAAILAHTFHPLYKNFLNIFSLKGLSSLLTCIIVALIIFVPIILVLGMVASELQGVLAEVSQSPGYVTGTINQISQSLSSWTFVRDLGLTSSVNPEAIVATIKSFSKYALPLVQSTYSGLGHILFTSFIMFFSLFYLLIDGEKLVGKLMLLSPLRNKYENLLVDKFNSITRATIRGHIFLSAVQGFLGGVIFWITGVSSPVILSIIMTMAAVIPAVGTGIIWIPVGIIMLVLGSTVSGVIILLCGLLIIVPMDNILAPKLIGGNSRMHPLLILMSIIGGLMYFGISGFIIGPIVMAFFIAFLDIYSLEFKNQLEDCNKV